MRAELDISTSVDDSIRIKGGRRKWWDTEQKDHEEDVDVDEENEKEGFSKPQEIIQVLHKIDSFESGAKRWIVFSAIGCVSSSSSYSITNREMKTVQQLSSSPLSHRHPIVLKLYILTSQNR